ncbi:ubiquitin-like small modifier protein 1 [Halorientalis marina]|jgi:molybdopterin synthase sulfur carrier subunit|uniref:ubiquitin-like small modifier protein 1 n=1 Tax=Halorientalis marina TaxID=2931976 RepID=UPI001FF13ED7|nr:ubiquitin-like small modifier protein 1 [Halorientalis marina]
MPVELRYFATVREAVGQRTETRELPAGTTIREVLATLEDEHPDLDGRLLDGEGVADSVTVLRNGTHVTHLDGVDTELADGDHLAITPPVTGG